MVADLHGFAEANDCEMIAVGNGAGGRKTAQFVRDFLAAAGKAVPNVMVREAGASVYSASEIAREEFPDPDQTVRCAISIALGDNSAFGGMVSTPFHEDYVFYGPTLTALGGGGAKDVLLAEGKMVI
jgi:hypothetical protein